jgi:mRNA interferase RelE/StbE
MEVEVSGQVNHFIRCQPPESRQRLRLALRALSQERGDIKALEGPLTGLYRLRIGRYRVLFAYATPQRGAPVIRCIFAECRDVVYEVFEQLMTERLLLDRSSGDES